MATSVARKTGASGKTPGRRAAGKTPAPARTAAAKPTAPDKSAPAAADAPKKAAPASGKDKAQHPDEAKKLKLVRDSFTFPKLEYGIIGVLKTRASHLGRPTKKSEIVRAGIKALLGMTDADFMACVRSVTPAKSKTGDKG